MWRRVGSDKHACPCITPVFLPAMSRSRFSISLLSAPSWPVAPRIREGACHRHPYAAGALPCTRQVLSDASAKLGELSPYALPPDA
jgi:hypothetical protein